MGWTESLIWPRSVLIGFRTTTSPKDRNRGRRPIAADLKAKYYGLAGLTGSSSRKMAHAVSPTTAAPPIPIA